MAKEVVIARLYGFEHVTFPRKDGSGMVDLFRLYFDYEDSKIKGYGTANASIFAERFGQDRLQLGDSCYIVIDNGKCDYCGKAPVPAEADK